MRLAWLRIVLLASYWLNVMKLLRIADLRVTQWRLIWQRLAMMKNGLARLRFVTRNWQVWRLFCGFEVVGRLNYSLSVS